MQKIDKSKKTLPVTYKAWLAKKDKGEVENKDFRHYYDDIVMNLYKCQKGVCTYTEMFICIPELYDGNKWVKGRYKIPDVAEYRRVDHLGELDHFNSENKKIQYWNWDNLFMIHSKINSIKSGNITVAYLKPDLPAYIPEKYFEYDDQTHRFVVNTDIEDLQMIDKVLCLNHGVVRNDRRDYINVLMEKKQRGEEVKPDRFFTAVRWALFQGQND